MRLGDVLSSPRDWRDFCEATELNYFPRCPCGPSLARGLGPSSSVIRQDSTGPARRTPCAMHALPAVRRGGPGPPAQNAFKWFSFYAIV